MPALIRRARSVTLDVDSQMSVSGKPGTGGFVRSQFKYERYLDDDAHLISSDDGGASNLRIQMGGFENYQGQRRTSPRATSAAASPSSPS